MPVIASGEVTPDPRPSFDLDGRVAIVTGASSGLGERFARVLNALGATVVVAARRTDRLESLCSELDNTSWVGADLRSADDAMGVVATTVERHGRVDVVVNNAGAAIAVPAFRESVADWVGTFQLNLLAPVILAKAAAGHMRQQGGGSIVMISSANALRSTTLLPQASYVAVKSGLLGATRELALQWARYGVRVNAIAPGMFRTEANALIDDDQARATWEQTIPLGHVGRPHELDGLLAFLASDASSFVTGQVIAADGGYSIG